MRQKECVWDYPRPPKLEKVLGEIKVIHKNQVVASTCKAFRVLEKSHPPTYYIPKEDVKMDLLLPNNHHSFCEWKGKASYWDLMIDGEIFRNVAWSYPLPNDDFLEITDYLAFYPAKVDECLVEGEKAEPQHSDFYGGWITSNIVGPFKSEFHRED